MSRTALKSATLALARSMRDEIQPGMVIGMDPGTNTGVAFYQDGKLLALETITPHHIERVLTAAKPSRVVFEDSRLQSHTWTTAKSRAAALKMARNVGQVDQICNQITAICEELGITAHGISPQGKGAKVAAEAFGRITGWAERCNCHERDAAMVAWPYRKSRVTP